MTESTTDAHRPLGVVIDGLQADDRISRQVLSELNGLLISVTRELESGRLPAAEGSPAGELHDIASNTRSALLSFLQLRIDVRTGDRSRLMVALIDARGRCEKFVINLADVKSDLHWLGVYRLSGAAISLISALGQLEAINKIGNWAVSNDLGTSRAQITITRRALGAAHPLEVTEEELQQAEELRRQTELAATEARLASESAAESAGVASEARLSVHFGTTRDREARAANILRFAAVGLFSLSFVAAFFVVRDALNSGETAIGTLLVRLGVGLPILGLAIYLAHESTGHRTIARRADEFQVRMDTVSGYAAKLGKKEGDELVLAVGQSVLTGPVLLSGGTEGAVVDTQKLMDKVVDSAFDRLPGGSE